MDFVIDVLEGGFEVVDEISPGGDSHLASCELLGDVEGEDVILI